MSQLVPSESVVLCEGFHDRAFWQGWFLKLGCTDPGKTHDKKGARGDVRDPFGEIVRRGDFAFISPSGGFIRVRPCHGKDNLVRVARVRLQGRSTEGLRRLVICRDLDSLASEKPVEGIEQAIGAAVASVDASSVRTPDGDWLIDGSAMVVSLVQWQAADDAVEGVPDHQTLERLVCAAIAAAYPNRSAAVSKWLESRPDAPPACVKDFAWSYMAGWAADQGCDTFYAKLWEDATVAHELEQRLRASGAWRIAEDLVS